MLSDGIVKIDLDRALQVRVRIPYSGYDVQADLSKVSSSVTELTLKDLAATALSVS